MRRIGKMINPVVEEAQRHLQGGRRELALKSLRDGLRYRRWHPLLEPQLRTQIGLLLYDQGETDEALEELKRGSSRPWESPAFLGCAYFKKREEAAMAKAFEKAVKVARRTICRGRSTPGAWRRATRRPRRRGAQARRREAAGERAPQEQPRARRGGKKMKVAPYGDRWRASASTQQAGVPKQMRASPSAPASASGPSASASRQCRSASADPRRPSEPFSRTGALRRARCAARARLRPRARRSHRRFATSAPRRPRKRLRRPPAP